MSKRSADNSISDREGYPSDDAPGMRASEATGGEDVTTEGAGEDRETALEEDARAIAERARRRALETLGRTLRQYRRQTETPELSDEDLPPSEGGDEPSASSESRDALILPPRPARPRPTLTMGADGIITLRYEGASDAPRASRVSEDEEEPEREEEPEEEPEEAVDDEPEPEDEPETEPEERENDAPPPRQAGRAHVRSGPSFAERFLAPVVRLLAVFRVRDQLRKTEAENWPEPVPQRRTPELAPSKAAGYYARQVAPLRNRCRVALALTLILTWISLSLPMAGMLRVSMPLQAGVSLVLMLAVMMLALDVITAGLRQISELRPGPEALVTIASIIAGVDGTLVLLGYGGALPFCAVNAAALTAALWGECLRCTALCRTFQTADAARSPAILSCGETPGLEGQSLFRTERTSLTGIVRRSEIQELCRTAYVQAAPLMLGAALVLSVWASIGKGMYFLHTLSALLSVCLSFAAFFSFPLSYVVASRRMRGAGVALAGYAGAAEIGRNRRIVLTDEDLFPHGTMAFSEINILEGVDPAEAVGCAASLLRELGSGVAVLFDELVERRGYRVPEADEFQCHEGGGLSAVIGGERILVGTAGFMNLMGIRLPQNLNPKNAVCTAVSGELVAVFVIEYTPVKSVQQALLTLLRGRSKTVFAIRDFNITPLMLRQLFRLPSDSFHFPSYLDRCRIGMAVDQASRIDAVLVRNGALPLAEAAEAGRKLYLTSRISTVLSLIGAAAGMLIMFLLCRAGSFDTATPGNVLSFMTLWSLPMLIMSIGQNR